MSYGTYTTTESVTFTVTHARYIGLKIGTDLKRMQRFYNQPNDYDIEQYEKEVIALLKDDYLEKIEYGFKDGNNVWKLALKYEARHGGIMLNDDDPGGIKPSIDISQCSFHSFLVTNIRWSNLTDDQQDQVYHEAGIAFRRYSGNEPFGKWMVNRGYSSGGRGVLRSDLYH